MTRRKKSIICVHCKETFDIMVSDDSSECLVVCPHCAQQSRLQLKSNKLVKIFARGKDMLVIEGCQMNEKLSLYISEGEYVACSDGTLAQIQLENGVWRFNLLFQGFSFARKEEGSGDSDLNETLYMREDLKWIVCGNDKVTVAK